MGDVYFCSVQTWILCSQTGRCRNETKIIYQRYGCISEECIWFNLSMLRSCRLLVTSIKIRLAVLQSECRMVWICIRHNILHVLVCVQTGCKCDQHKNSKWVWSGKNTTITNRRQPCGTARKSRPTITRHQEDKLSKAASSLFPIKMIVMLERTQSNVQQNIEQLQTPTMGVTINKKSTTTEPPP